MGRARKKERNISTTTTSEVLLLLPGYYYSNMWKNNMCFQIELNCFRGSTTTTTTTVLSYYHHSSGATITIGGSSIYPSRTTSVPVKTISTISRLNQDLRPVTSTAYKLQ